MSRIKAQVSIEFLILVFFALVIFLFALYSFQQKNQEVQFHRDLLLAKSIVDEISSSVNNAYLGIACNRNIYLPTTINSKNYTLSYLNDSHLLLLYWDEGAYSFPIISSDIKINTSVKNSYYLNCSGGVSLD